MKNIKGYAKSMMDSILLALNVARMDFCSSGRMKISVTSIVSMEISHATLVPLKTLKALWRNTKVVKFSLYKSALPLRGYV